MKAGSISNSSLSAEAGYGGNGGDGDGFSGGGGEGEGEGSSSGGETETNSTGVKCEDGVVGMEDDVIVLSVGVSKICPTSSLQWAVALCAGPVALNPWAMGVTQ